MGGWKKGAKGAAKWAFQRRAELGQDGLGGGRGWGMGGGRQGNQGQDGRCMAAREVAAGESCAGGWGCGKISRALGLGEGRAVEGGKGEKG